MLGRYGSSIGADLVRQLALSPGSTLVRLLVDPADGRCVERTTGSYAFDAAMRAQLAAADVTCRAPGCLQPAGVCQADHVTEHGTPGGETREANGQLVHVWHHQAKTAKAWDAVLHANRDVTWTTLLSRVYRTRVHDYRELVTLLVAAHQRVAATAPEGLSDQVDAEVYAALSYRGPGERLHEGDDDPREEDHLLRFGGWGLVSLSHRDPVTGHRVAGPSPAAQARGVVAARSATERVRRGAERLRRDEGPPPF